MEFPLTIVVVIIMAIVLLKVAKSIASKLFGIVIIAGLILGFMYYKGIGPFKKSLVSIDELSAKYCDSSGDKDICDCILKPAREDIYDRFSKSERDSLAVQKVRAAYVLQKSLNATKEEALVCLAARNQTDKYKVFLQDFVPIDNKYLDLIGEKARSLSRQLKDEFNELKENKEDIDSKY